MTCKKCGAPLDGTSKFCGVCGAPVEVENNPQPSQPTLNNIFAEETAAPAPVPSAPEEPKAPTPVPAVPEEPKAPTPVEGPAPMPKAPEGPQGPAPMPKAPEGPQGPAPMPKAPEGPQGPAPMPGAPAGPQGPAPMPGAPEGPQGPAPMPGAPAPKKNGGGKGAIAVLIAIVGIALVGFLVWNFCIKSSGGKIENLTTALANIDAAGKDSATLKATLAIRGQDASQSINFALTTKAVKSDDKVDIELKLDKSMFFDEIDVFGSIGKDSVSLYIPSSVIDMFGATSSMNNVWLKYEKTFEELGVDSKEIDFSSSEKIDIDYSQIFNNDTVKYVGKKDGLQQYQLVVDKKLINKIIEVYKSMDNFKDIASELEDSASEFEEALKGLTINFYLNDKNEFVKMSAIYANDVLKQSGLNEIEFTIEFMDLGTTVITIPSEALNSSKDLETYIEENSSYDIDFDDDSFGGLSF